MATGKIIQADQVVGIDAKPNLITNPFGFLNTQGWDGATYTAATRPSGTPSAGASLLSISSVAGGLSTAPKKLRLSKAVGNAQGQAREFIMDVPEGYQTEMLALELLYKVTDTDFVAGSSSVDSSLIVYTAQSADGVTYTMTEPRGGFKLTSKGIPDRYKGWVQMNSDTTKLKLILYVADTTNAAWDLDFEACVSPSECVAGTIVTETSTTKYATSLNNLSTNVTGFANNSAQVGDCLKVVGSFSFTGANTQNVGEGVLINMPSGLTIAGSKIQNSTYRTAIGKWSYRNNIGVIFSGPILVATGVNGDSVVQLGGLQPQNNLPTTIAANDSVGFEFDVPVRGWSAGAQMSDGYDGGVVASGNFSTTSITTSFAQLGLTVSQDVAGMVSGNDVIIRTAGQYALDAFVTANSASVTASDQESAIYVNGTVVRSSLITSAYWHTTTTHYEGFLNVGDVVQFYARTSTGTCATSATRNSWSVKKLSGSAFMSPTATVACKYTNTAGTTIDTSITKLSFALANKVYDTHGSWNGTEFTAPTPGIYSVNVTVQGVGAYPSAQYLEININGSTIASCYDSSTAQGYRSNSSDFELKAGDKISIVFRVSSGSTTLSTGSPFNYISIHKVK